MVVLEISIDKQILNDMIEEQEIINSSCFIRKDEVQDDISQEFLKTILLEYKLNSPTDNLTIKITKQN